MELIHEFINGSGCRTPGSFLFGCCSVVKLCSTFATSWTAAHQASLSFTSPGVCSNSHPLSQWCYLTISSSASLFSFCLQSFPAPGSIPVSQLFTSGGQSIGASASVLSKNIQAWFLLGLTDLILLWLWRCSLYSDCLWRGSKSNSLGEEFTPFPCHSSVITSFPGLCPDLIKIPQTMWITRVGRRPALLMNKLSTKSLLYLTSIFKNNFLIVSCLWFF